MQFNSLGSTGIKVSALAFGAGPISGLMTSDKHDLQCDTLRRALEAGINWIDTAATYGEGQSEASLGHTLRALNATDKVHIATKVRLAEEDLHNIETKIRDSVASSLERLGTSQITLLQLHNSITPHRGDQPTSVTPDEVLGEVLSTFQKLQTEGLVAHLGLTALGEPKSLRKAINSGQFATIQVPYNLLNPSAGTNVSIDFAETDYGNIINDCNKQNMGVFAIRVFAGGALAGQPPSQHTYKTKFFPLDLYQRDQQRVKQLSKLLEPHAKLRKYAVRFVLSHPHITSAIVGFGAPAHIDETLNYLSAGPLASSEIEKLNSSNFRTVSNTTLEN